jgi:hypothetical protein
MAIVTRLRHTIEGVGSVSSAAAVVVLLLRMNLPWWGDILGAGAAAVVWVVTASELAQKGQSMSHGLNFSLGLLNFIASLAALLLGVLGVVHGVRCGFCGPWGG